ncbi:uncharacterized protein LAJ45_07708 [Morchella importuna]|uniref:Dihydrodipicolinate synthase n=1 Tax=Morchella conica CCBAS932 TaxID=1392247 RepID=A0A3N4KA93_9PEZI|nr:uncharacterized protein LAJ45_07708 [Morchella importuna]KAH8148256.1 hypothetical protein LAJ45_07708 [Morchella importuna]RPB07420.1 dihydrodipicolinate synthase [Morchella conica CCBAS932]
MPSIPTPGVWVPVPTFFTPAGALDTATQAAHSLHLARNGIAGIVLLGSTGEAVHLSRAERSEMISAVRAALNKNGFEGYPLMAGTMAGTVDETVELLVEAGEAGAQFGLVLAPGYFAGQVSQANVEAWYSAVADASPLPILIYHYPGVSNNIQISMETFERLSQHPNIVGAKFSHGNISHHAQVALSPEIAHKTFRLYSGQGQQLLPVVMVGGAGVIDGLAATFPKTVVRLYQLATTLPMTDEALVEARQLQWLVSKASELVCVKWAVVGIKECVARVLGMGNLEGGRLPIKGCVKDIGGDWAAVEQTIEELVSVEKSL